MTSKGRDREKPMALEDLIVTLLRVHEKEHVKPDESELIVSPQVTRPHVLTIKSVPVIVGPTKMMSPDANYAFRGKLWNNPRLI